MDTYDYVVVGAGSAGCTIAARLSEDAGVTVAVLEAGRRDLPEALQQDVEIPSHWRLLWNTMIDWGYESVPQEQLFGRRVPEPRGKVPGGSSKLYILMHIRGHRSDYDNWAYNGCPGWSYDDVLPYFQKLEDQEDDTNPTGGKGGPLRVQNAGQHQPSPVSQAFIDACIELGFRRTDDFNGPQMEGTGWHHVNIKDGKRHSTDVAYLNPALAARKNLTLIDDATATRLLFQGRRCVGVDYLRGGQPQSVTANSEVIVCAGAIDSPKLLLLSGVGNGDQLWRLGIPVLVSSPGVGENFHNHVLVAVICSAPRPIPPHHQNTSEAALFYKSDPGWPGPDMQMGFVPCDPAQIESENPPPVMIMLPGLVRPLARGWVRLASPDPLAKPLINPNYLGCESDFRRLVDAVRLSRRIYATRALGAWVQTEVAPGPALPDEQLGDYVRQAADCYHHQVGSCRMGLDAQAVVGPDLRVHGTEGLRVADASVMPAVPSGNCHAGIVMIAEKCADMIKAARA
jgi:choline dehydrogenase-like flavoprotein